MNRKSDLRVMVMEGMKIAPKVLQILSTAGATILSPLSPYDSLLMPNMWYFSWQKYIVSRCDCGIPRVDVKISL